MQSNFKAVELWLYKYGNGTTEVDIPEIAGKPIKGRLYKDGIFYKPSGGGTGLEQPDPAQKEFKYEQVLGKLFFAFETGETEPIDIPYEDDNT